VRNADADLDHQQRDRRRRGQPRAGDEAAELHAQEDVRLFPAPGPLLALGAPADGLLSVSMFEPNKATLDKLGGGATEIVTRLHQHVRQEAKLPYTTFETQAGAS
jgi:hypothetical protein